jgi:hypothetical protein
LIERFGCDSLLLTFMESVHAIVASCQKSWPKIALSLMLLNGCGADHRVLEEVVEKVYTVEPNVNVSIQNRDGAILVYGSDVNEVRVRSLKKAYSQERLNQIAVDMSTKSAGVSIITKFRPQPKWAFSDRSGTVEYTIVLPATASISSLELNAGEVLLESMRGPEVRARLNDGRIFARNCFTNLDLTANRGTLGLSYEWCEHEEFSAQAKLAQGNIWVWLPSEAAFHLIADTAHGKIANDFNNLAVSANSPAKGMKIDQIINGGGPATIQVRVDKGNIKIAEANP